MLSPLLTLCVCSRERDDWLGPGTYCIYVEGVVDLNGLQTCYSTYRHCGVHSVLTALHKHTCLLITALTFANLQPQIYDWILFCFAHYWHIFVCKKCQWCACFLKHSSPCNWNSDSSTYMSLSFSFRLLFLTFFYYAVGGTSFFFTQWTRASITPLSSIV